MILVTPMMEPYTRRSTIMNSKTTTRALFLAGMIFASSAFAGADINKCVSASGSVTLTDEACPSNAETIKIVSKSDDSATDDSAQSGAPAMTPARVSVERYTVARLPARNVVRTRAAEPARGLSLDIATLKAARMNMQLVEHAAQSTRSPRLAGLQ